VDRFSGGRKDVAESTLGLVDLLGIFRVPFTIERTVSSAQTDASVWPERVRVHKKYLFGRCCLYAPGWRRRQREGKNHDAHITVLLCIVWTGPALDQYACPCKVPVQGTTDERCPHIVERFNRVNLAARVSIGSPELCGQSVRRTYVCHNRLYITGGGS